MDKAKIFAGCFSRPPLERMMRLHDQLKAQQFPNCKKAAKDLAISPKTIQRDIDFMHDRLGLPIAYDQHRFGFYYSTKPERGLPFPWSV